MQKKNLVATSILAASCFAVGCSSGTRGTAQSDRQRINPNIASSDTSMGGTQSQRQRETGAPLPQGSSQAGTTGTPSPRGDMRQGMSSDTQRINPDISSPGSSYGGTQSQRQRETGAPLPEGSSQAGTTGTRGSDTQWTAENVKQAQEALKSKGFYSGAADGVMDPDTQQAIRAFQSANGLQQTGTLDAQTAQRLGLRR